MAYLYEAWLSAGQDWKKSRLVMQAGTKSGTVKRGKKCWMTHKQITDKYGDDVAQAIVEYKIKDAELSKTEVRWNPNCPFSEAGTYLPCGLRWSFSSYSIVCIFRAGGC